ncbi:hypothetical protein M422DRAFT_37320 [Sphaerobolus stellatus SS14]|uniref:Unplaced genomic scaffold SPHSTscaffold_228, whole genome shotgun sequence n=1 Tax=Sphaerobolus stellatus (strain SS14) TaxID=990650 RepID=A0A0C9UI06_SPHS4|nr:hypothetical protein M422DRAFT_37320 [Sphaerobolus stellatus SS14]
MKHVKQISELQWLRSVRYSGRLVSLLSLAYRDGVLIYASILCVWIVDGVIIIISSKRVLQGFAVPWLAAVYSISISRLVLVLEGRPFNPTGVYKTGNEYRIQAETHEDEETGQSISGAESVPLEEWVTKS